MDTDQYQQRTQQKQTQPGTVASDTLPQFPRRQALNSNCSVCPRLHVVVFEWQCLVKLAQHSLFEPLVQAVFASSLYAVPYKCWCPTPEDVALQSVSAETIAAMHS